MAQDLHAHALAVCVREEIGTGEYILHFLRPSLTRSALSPGVLTTTEFVPTLGGPGGCAITHAMHYLRERVGPDDTVKTRTAPGPPLTKVESERPSVTKKRLHSPTSTCKHCATQSPCTKTIRITPFFSKDYAPSLIPLSPLVSLIRQHLTQVSHQPTRNFSLGFGKYTRRASSSRLTRRINGTSRSHDSVPSAAFSTLWHYFDPCLLMERLTS
ncbi:hypothetical protein EDB86DRAFT_651420 [Lactarius hatsudake]|nr:hypothetical protein EDB86DRAFT_651420 [Lactarius hatsudake]